MRVGSLVAGLVAVWLQAAAAQQGPLRKTDLVRLLTNPSMSKQQVADRIKATCLAFDPTGRDRVDLATLGAEQTVMAAINECVRKKTAAAAPAAAPPAAAPTGRPQAPVAQPPTARPTAPVTQPPATTPTPPAGAGPTRPAAAAATPAASGARIVVLQLSVSADAGTDASFQVQVSRGGRPAPGLPLTIRGQQDIRATSDARGVATFRVPAGTAAGTRQLAIVAVGEESAAGAPVLRLTTRAGPPKVVELDPPRLQVRPGQPAGRQALTLRLKDAYGNAVAGERVDFRPLTPGLGLSPFGGQTDRAGQLSVAFATATFRSNGAIGVFVRGAQQGSLGVVVGQVVLSQGLTRFVSGTGQRGVAGQPLGQPLVLEVYDTTGAPVAGEAVTLTAANASVAPSATTDPKGQVSVTVTAGRQAGQSTVTVSVGAVRKEATFAVAPGSAKTLVVLRDTTRLGPTLSLSSTRPVLLRVMARDTFGNDVPVTALRASASNPQVLRVARADTAGGAGRVELRPHTSGTARLDLEAEGLRQTVPAEVLLPVGGGAGGVVAFRAGYTGFSYHFLKLALRGSGGPFFEVNFGWTLTPGLRLATGISVARVGLDTGTTHAPTTLMDGSLRLEFSPLRNGSVRPVMALGGGQYQTRVPDLHGLGRHTSQFWLAGAGLDFPLRNRAVVEFRAMTHQLHQSKTRFADAGSVGSLMAVTLGFRFGS